MGAHHLHRDEALSLDQFGLDLEEHPRRAARWIIHAASQGELEAQALLGQILLDGRGIEQDQALALQWFSIAAERGHAMAANMAGRCHEHGWGCVADLSRAARYYRKAAGQGLDWSLYNLANLVATGRGVAQDQASAFALYRRAAELGHAKSMNLVGRYLEEGLMVPADRATAWDWYRRSAEAGDFRGQFSYAAVLISEQRWDDARHWLIQALSLGHLKFLRKARDELLAAKIAPIADITAKYAARCAEIGDQSDTQIAARPAATQPVADARIT
ncbi:sel1 repeat family protein [Stutzerimonas sp. VN223-3]|uniref:tetratricopeptide repeat protein n=1 Tax=Stutzerimonas sp. VN223-3 TaxID=3384601 RepID=UPI0038B5A1DC